MKMLRRIGPVLISFVAFSGALVTQAQSQPVSTATLPTNLLTSPGAVTKLLCGLLGWMFWALIVFAIAMFLWGGFSYARAGDKPEQVSKANHILLYAAIAVVVALLANTIPIVIGNLFGVQLTTC